MEEKLEMPGRLGADADAVVGLAWAFASSYLTFHSDTRFHGMGCG